MQTHVVPKLVKTILAAFIPEPENSISCVEMPHAHNASLYIPWSWVVTPLNATSPETPCPSYHSILGTFAAVNSLMLISPLIFGNGRLVNKISCGIWGNEDPSRSWLLSWAIPFTMQLISNALIAALMKHTVGYKTTFSNGDLVAFYAARPRLSWLFLSFLATTPEYWNSFLSNLICEFLLQCVGMGYMAKTIRFASKHHYLLPVGSDGIHNVPQAVKDIPAGGLLLYAGAMVYVVFFAIFILVMLYNILAAIGFSSPSNRDPKGLGIALAFPFAFTWAGSWMFWAGYLQIAGDL